MFATPQKRIEVAYARTTIPMAEIRTVRRGATLTVHAYTQTVYLEVDGAGMLDGLYAWSDAATSGIVGGIQHCGNHLHGTEFRPPATSDGDWVMVPRLSHGHVVETAGLSHLSNGFPGLRQVQAALTRRDVDGWECRNPEGGHNNEWIPLTAEAE